MLPWGFKFLDNTTTRHRMNTYLCDTTDLPDTLLHLITNYSLAEELIVSNERAVAIKLADERVITFGDPEHGGDCKSVFGQLRGVNTVVNNERAFAALRHDGRVVTWGCKMSGGDSSSVQPVLEKVVHIVATRRSFAALREDGRVFTWGYDSLTVAKLQNVVSLHASRFAFTVKLNTGRIMTWGKEIYSGIPYEPSLNNRDHIIFKTIISTSKMSLYQFAGISTNGRVFTWAPGCRLQEHPSPHSAKRLYANAHALLIELEDGSWVTHGNPAWGGENNEVRAIMNNNVAAVCVARSAFFVKLKTGKLIAWGCGGTDPLFKKMADETTDIETIHTSGTVCAVKRRNGFVVIFGSDRGSGSVQMEEDKARPVEKVYPTARGFVLKYPDGRFSLWNLAPGF